MRTTPAALAAAVAAALSLAGSTGCASPPPADPSGAIVCTIPYVPGAWREDPRVETALREAKGNRDELERFLTRWEESGDEQKAEAAHFLVANMPGKGFVRFVWKDAKGGTFDFDPIPHGSFKAALAALDAIEKERGSVEAVRGGLRADVETLTESFLSAHLDRSFEVWRAVPGSERPSFDVFREYVLPYRGSEEPAEDWLGPLVARVEEIRAALPPGAGRAELRRAVTQACEAFARFDEVWYLHPTDQGWSEIAASHQGRCEDLSNLQTYFARAMCWPVACDYTPAWGHSDNNHAWTVDLGRDGRGCAKEYAHAAKVYRKTFSTRHGLRNALPAGHEPPNRWVANPAVIDVTADYGHCADVLVRVDPAAAAREKVAYLAVFNGGDWVEIAWTPRVADTVVGFGAMGRGLLYLPTFHDGKVRTPAGAPFVLEEELLQGRPGLRALPGDGPAASVVLTATAPMKTSVDTGETTPVSHLRPGAAYVLRTWRDGWTDVEEFTATSSPRTVTGLAANGLHWLVEKGGRALERPFTIENGLQRFR